MAVTRRLLFCEWRMELADRHTREPPGEVRVQGVPRRESVENLRCGPSGRLEWVGLRPAA